ncbi:PQQ-binding-like beta-propeller repeat protein, partial [Candidatus Bathyarchaeota archaeon]|nr:PQQ-binding-like beta-propeller repeat protein [Candidatus Bathyarchaeota archaeon]
LVYIGSYDGKVYCLSASTGTKLWSYATGGPIAYSSPAVAGGLVYVGSYDGSVYCLSASTGAFIWSYATGGGVYSSPAVAGGMVYVGSYDGSVLAFGPVHDVAVTNVTTCKDSCIGPLPCAGQNYTMHINVTVENQGNYTETFTVTVYANATAINQTVLVLPSAASTVWTFRYNATLPYGNYTISAVADTVPGETDTLDNARAGCKVLVTIPGDAADPFLWVTSKDLTYLLGAYGTRPYNPNCDITDDGNLIGSKDLTILLKYFGKHYP